MLLERFKKPERCNGLEFRHSAQPSTGVDCDLEPKRGQLGLQPRRPLLLALGHGLPFPTNQTGVDFVSILSFQVRIPMVKNH
jgi:hypothetical protein